MTGQFDIHQAAIAGIGQAKILDARTRTHEFRLIGDIEQALKKHMPRVTQGDVVQAVKLHYEHSDEIVTGEAIVAVIRRVRLAEFRAEQEARRDYLTDQQRRQMLDDWDAIRQWDCDEPGCGAGPGVYCTNALTKEPMKHAPGHLSRIRKAYQPQGKAS